MSWRKMCNGGKRRNIGCTCVVRGDGWLGEDSGKGIWAEGKGLIGSNKFVYCFIWDKGRSLC